MIKILILVLLTSLFSGCFMGVETKSGFHMTGWPPTVKRLSQQCSGPYFIPIENHEE